MDMENKINIAEILKDCPQGMELDCTVFNGKICFEGFDHNNSAYPIKISVNLVNIEHLNIYGQYNTRDYAKCIIFPKGKTTWEGFVPPCTFKAGDVLVSEAGNIVLFSHIDYGNLVHYHCIIPTYGSLRIEEKPKVGVGRYYECVLANEQQRQRMYDKIKSSGHKYNQNTNKLEKLIEPIFKVGDRIRHKEKTRWACTISRVEDRYYVDGHPICFTLPFVKQKDYELVPNKFDITTLKPFDKVLVRDNNEQKWTVDLFSFYDKDLVYKYVCVGHYVNQCIPYEGNEHLLGKRDDCDEYYKTWE